MDKKDIRSFELFELEDEMKNLGEPKFRALQIFKWLQEGIENFDEMTNVPASLRSKLQEGYYIVTVKIKKRLASQVDDTVKYLYELYDGEYVEAVLMNYHHGYTMCISTQVGCRMGCSFCATGLAGLKRNLLPSEMTAQIKKAEQTENIRVSNVVLMGMGEPLDNFDNVIKFLRLVSDDNGMNIGLRHISLSTSGIVPGIKKLSKLKLPVTLSVSLHAPNDEIRSSMMRINKKWNVTELISACKEYLKNDGRRISFEYAVIDGVNDTDECAKELYKLLKGMLCHVNLIPVNPVKENSYKKPDRAKIERFQKKLNDLGLNATIRRTLGPDIEASCGQLRGKETSNT